MRDRSARPIFAALYGVMSRQVEAGPIGPARSELVSQARGEVVDLGAGHGANLAHLGAGVTRVHLVEPNPYMVRRLRLVRPSNGVIHEVGAERLPLADGSVDTVLATLVLCTVENPVTVLTEARRVLRPEGRLLVLEHVRAEAPRSARWQDRLERPWGWFSGGCHPNRDTAAVLAGAGFDVSPLSRFLVPGQPIVRSWISGALELAG
jgi:ubiquinone/menaquinone biosynthesis C-methylase UbiE